MRFNTPKPTLSGSSIWLMLAACLLLICCGGGGDSSKSTPTAPTPPPPAASTAVGNYGTDPCCCDFWTVTFARAGRTESWTCWGWIEIRAQSGSQISGLTDMERGDARTCDDDHRCANGMAASAGQIDTAGALTWTIDTGGGPSYMANRVAEESGCSVVSGGGTFTGNLVGDTLSVTTGSVLSCGGSMAQLTVTGRGQR